MSQIKRFLTENLVLGFEDFLKRRPTRKFLSQARSFSFESSESIRELQLDKLRTLLIHAYQHVPFYTKRFNNYGIDPYSFSGLDDLNSLPPLTRSDLQTYFKNDLRASNYSHNNCYFGTTGGSTGVPVSFIRDNRCLAIGTAASYAGWEMSGWHLGEPTLTIWGNPTTVKTYWKNPSSRMKSFLSNQFRFPAYQLKSSNAFMDLTSLLLSVKPKYITGYTRAIYLLSEYLHNHNITLDFPIFGVLTTAETLYSNHRGLIESYLGPVYDCYGCGEIHSIAYQCTCRANYHIMDWHVIVQYESIPGIEESNLLITDLDNFAFPLIKYKNGDMAVCSKSTSCECGRHTNQISRISGRTSDIIRTKSGGYFVIPSFLGSTFFRNIDGILEYQFVRTLTGIMQMRIRVSDRFNVLTIDTISNYLGELLGDNESWEIRTDLPIIYSNSGKAKVLHQEIEQA